MARMDDAADGLRAIGVHREALLDAYLNHHGSIPDSEENKPVIRALLKHHLAWRLEEDEPVQISSALTPTLSAVTRSYRRTTADLSIAHLWSELQEAIEVYQDAKQRGSHADSETYIGMAYDLGHQLIENLREAVTQFSHHISSGFTYIHDLHLRARENRRVILRASQLNDVLETFDHASLQQLAGVDPQLRRLLLRALPKALEACGKELLHAIVRLTEMLHTITRHQRLSQLIDAVAGLYQADHAYTPDIEWMEDVPPAVNMSVPVLQRSMVDPRNPEHEDDLTTIVNSLPKLDPLEEEAFTPSGVQDVLEQATEVIAPHPVQVAANLMIEMALESPSPISAQQIHRAYPVESDMEMWLLTLVNTVNALPDKQRQQLDMSFVESTDPVLSGNRWVRDLTLQRTGVRVYAA